MTIGVPATWAVARRISRMIDDADRHADLHQGD
jgi:hypothetical protein